MLHAAAETEALAGAGGHESCQGPRPRQCSTAAHTNCSLYQNISVSNQKTCIRSPLVLSLHNLKNFCSCFTAGHKTQLNSTQEQQKANKQ